MPKRGQKNCKNCGTTNGVRRFTCINCNEPFKMRKPPKRRAQAVDDWNTLLPGDRVRVVGGNGTYYIDETGERQYLVDRGVYIVYNKTHNGLQVYGAHGGGYSFLYMGPETRSSLCDDLFRAPHKLVKLRPAQTS